MRQNHPQKSVTFNSNLVEARLYTEITNSCQELNVSCFTKAYLHQTFYVFPNHFHIFWKAVLTLFLDSMNCTLLVK